MARPFGGVRNSCVWCAKPLGDAVIKSTLGVTFGLVHSTGWMGAQALAR